MIKNTYIVNDKMKSYRKIWLKKSLKKLIKLSLWQHWLELLGFGFMRILLHVRSTLDHRSWQLLNPHQTLGFWMHRLFSACSFVKLRQILNSPTPVDYADEKY